MAERFPILRAARVAVHRGGLPTMTPDGYPILGPLPGLEGFYVASGCCVGGLTLSPAAGRALADLILDGKSEPDLAPLSVERFRGRFDDPAELETACVGRYARKYKRSGLWEPARWPDRADLASPARMFFDHAKPADLTLDQMERRIEEGYRTQLY